MRLVLMAPGGHAAAIQTAFLTNLLLVCVVSVMGPEDHDYDDHRRSWWPGRSR